MLSYGGMESDSHSAARTLVGAARGGVTAPDRGSDTLPRLARGPVLGVAAFAFAVLMLVSASYGYHRDELYFLEASHHMAWGYVDQPPFSVASIWLSRMVFGDWLPGLRLLPAVAFAAAVLLAALIARELGGRRFAQVLTALLLASCPLLVAAHLAGPTIYDLVFWTLTSWLVIRILRTGRMRLWLMVGVVVGIGLQDKETILFLVIGLLAGFATVGPRRVLTSPWLWAAAVIALLIWLPNIVWQAQHGWPVLQMDRNLQADHSGLGDSLKFPFIQLLLLGIAAIPVALAGLWALLRDPPLRPYRAFAVAYVLLFFALLVFMGDRPYYLAPLDVVLMAAGSLVTVDVIAGRRRFFAAEPPKRRLVWRSPGAAFAFVLVTSALLLPIALPILPARVLATVPLQKINYNLGEENGWPELVATVAHVYRSLPPAERATTAIVTGNYGEAGAIDRYGAALGLPSAYSGHNSFWWWGPPRPALTTTIVVGLTDTPQYLERYFAQVREVATIHNRYGIANDEEGLKIWLCRGQKAPWPAIWPQFKHYD
jgi:4-amino-4-deoxy-L-arabinose transferase-like glycosyltransferase